MDSFLFANFLSLRLWYALPLVVAVSLVYAATRHESMLPILQHAWRIAVWIVGFMSIVFVILFLLEWHYL
ncbi:MAG: hypothetical protein CMJ81_14170 [Planctomycetaceae bacterium]|nr:hypothetical protein [Planctomycetaceae bacterium]MBP61527.1 hypothetical protein [Planctomycetaceae bacterium]